MRDREHLWKEKVKQTKLEAKYANSDLITAR